MKAAKLSLGLDISTQSISAVLVDVYSLKKVSPYSLDYMQDHRLYCFGIRNKDYLISPRVVGEADQPNKMFLASIAEGYLERVPGKWKV